MKKIYKLISILLLTTLLTFINTNILKASSATISVTSSTNKIVVGNTFSVTIKVSSSKKLGTWEFTPSYDTSKFKLISGESSVVGYGDGKLKAKSYSYKFKAIGTGNGTITVKSVGVIDYDTESKMSVTKGSKTITVITQSQLESSYSKNNNLKSLSIKGLKLSPSFNSSTTKYKANATANTTKVEVTAKASDSKSRVSGTGTKKVSEGENKINVTVTAQNGSTKTYTIIVNVTDPNPIEVLLNDIKYTVVKRESSLDIPEDYTKTTVEINKQKIPAFYNETNNITLVGLKNSDGDIDLYIYDKENETYKLYQDANLSTKKLLPLKLDTEFINKMLKDDYLQTNIVIDGIEFEALKRDNSEYSIIYAKDFSNGEINYYLYDEKANSIIRYFKEDKIIIDNDSKYKKQILEYKKMIMALGIETVLIIFILICILFSKVKKNKIRRKKILAKIEEEKRKEQEEKKQEEIKEVKKDNTKKKNTNKKKEVLNDDKKNKKSKKEN